MANERLEARRDRVVTEAIDAGKILAESADDYRRRWMEDPRGTEALLAKLAPGAAPTAAAEPPVDADEAYDQLYGHGEGGIG